MTTASMRRDLAAMERELRRLGDVVVVAPATEQSGVGHSITYLTPLIVKEVFRTDGDRPQRPLGLCRGRQPGRLRENRRSTILPSPPRPGRQRHQRRAERGDQRALFGHGGGGHRRGVLRHHQRGRLVGVRRTCPLRPGRPPGPRDYRPNPGPKRPRAAALQPEHPHRRAWAGRRSAWCR